jgi:phosphate transport system substrate-binding protein
MNIKITLFSVAVSLLILSPVTTSASTAGGANVINWAGCGITKKAFMKELAAEYTKRTGVVVNLSGGGATKGIRNAANGSIDIGGACRTTIDSSKEERNAHQIPVAWDALVVTINKTNPVSDISFQQLQKVYTGELTNWKQLGGNDAPIELYIRRGKLSGVGRTLRELVFHNFNQDFKATYVKKSSGPVEKGILKNPNGIGITGISSAKKRDLKLLSLNGHAPTYDNIKQGKYVLYRPLYLVTKHARVSKKVKDFIRFAVSRDGQEIIRQQGTVPYSRAMALVMKQLDQYDKAMADGLFHTQQVATAK